MAINASILAPQLEFYREERRMLGWNVPEDYLSYVHPHWLSFEAPNPYLHYMLGFFYIIFTVCSCLGNGVVIWIFSTAKSLRTPSNMLVVNLAILDFIMMVKMPVFIVNSFNEGPIWGKSGCDFYALLGSYSGFGGAVTNAAIAFDRYRTIARPFDGKLTRKQVTLVIIGIWLWATPFSIMPLLGIMGRFVPEGFLTSCTFDFMSDDQSTKFFIATMFFFMYVIPLSGILYYYSQIVGHVRKHEKTLREQARKMNATNLRANENPNDQAAEIRIAKVAIGLAMLFVFAWTPYACIALIATFGNRSALTPFATMIPALFCKSVACIDPWVYAINHPRYRLELQKRMPWFCIHEPNPELGVNATPSEISSVTSS